MRIKILPLFLALALFLSLLGGCAGEPGPAPAAEPSEPAEPSGAESAGEARAPEESENAEPAAVPAEYLGGELEQVALSSEPAVGTLLMPEASGTVVYQNTKTVVDASHSEDGYIMIAYTESTSSRIKVIVQGPSGTRYTYNLAADGQYDVFPLSDGSGNYSVGVYKNVSGTSYSVAYSTGLTVALKDEFAPFLMPNQYVNYGPDSAVVKKAAELPANSASVLDSIKAVYDYVVGNFSYDYDRAATVKSGYLPDLDDVLAKQKGICFDYAAVMAAMFRSQGIPCKLVVGYAGTVYHAWISCYSDSEGWMDGVIYFDGYNWKLLDPTYASTGNSSSDVMEYIGNSGNYNAKYLY
jgi:transglutaminase-like putative cysteine protease